jgi:hypothetical protein
MEDELIKEEKVKLLEKIGFNINEFLDTNHINVRFLKSNYNPSKDQNWYVNLTQSFLARWLREKHKIDVVPTFSEFGRTYGYKVYFIQNGETDFINHRYSKYETFELALEAGLQEALKLIKI